MGFERLEPSSCRAALEVLLELTRKLTGHITLEEALTTVTDAALGLLPCDHASVRVFDETRTSLLSGARSGEGSDEWPMAFHKGDGIVGWVAEHGEPILSSRVEDDPRFKPPDASQGFSIKSMIAVPLRAAEEVVGVLGVTSAQTDVFTEEHEVLAILLANCAVPSIERARLERIKAKLVRLAVMDHHTPAFNHRFLMPKLREEQARAARRWPLSLLLMDLDHFKGVNDCHGHAAGDCVLQSFARRVFSCVRNTDILVRRGGDEFALIMPHANGSRAVEVGERIREAVADPPLEAAAENLKVTVSIGVATWNEEESAESLEQRADKAMYEAKRRGRNRVTQAEPGPRS